MKKKQLRVADVIFFNKEIFYVMRLTVFMLFFGFLHVSGAGFSQQQKVTLKCEKETLSKVFKQLEKQTGLFFFFNDRIIDMEREVSLDVKDSDLAVVLNDLLHHKYNWEIVNNLIVVTEAVGTDENRPIVVKGIVQDVKKSPLPGVTVLLKGTSTGVTTNVNGEFSIVVLDTLNTELVFSFVGMKTITLKYSDRPKKGKWIITLEENVYALDGVDVVYTGYQRIDLRKNTSAISSVRAADVLVPGMTSIDQALEGRIPELQFTLNSGEVGATPRIRVRGTSSLIGNREPLWVLDGFILRDPVNVSNEDLNNPDYINIIGNAIAGINPQDIERIDVLKDAAATALYGTRAANGVIVITTKKGAIGEPQVTYSHTSKLTRRPRYTDRVIDLMNSQERVYFGKELADQHYKFPENMPMVGYEGALYRHQTGKTNWQEFQQEVAWYERVNTDWFGVLTHDTYSHDHTVSVSGGSRDIRYYVSLGYNYEDGVTKTTNTERITSMANLDIYFMKNLQVRFAMNANVQKKNHLQESINAMEYAYNTTRALPAFNEDGSLYFYEKIGYGGLNQPYNQFRYNILNEMHNSSNTYDGNTISATLDVQYTSIVKGLDLTIAGNYSRSNTLQENWWGEESHYVARYKNAEYEEAPPKLEEGHCQLPYGGILNTTHSIVESYTLRAQADYRKILGMEAQHVLSIMGGFEMNGSVNRTFGDQVFGYMKERGMQIVDGINLEDYPAYRDEWLNVNHRTRTHGITHELSGYLTLGYSYKDHFTLNANARTDASNAFGSRANEKILPIWSISGMWNMKENLLKRASVFSEFSLRASLGLQGNMQEDQSPNLIIRQGSTDPIYNENLSTVERFPNPNLSWEQTRSWDLGLDLGLFDSRLNLSLSYYDKKTEDCFTTVQVSTVNGLSSYVMNSGSITNRGYSIYLTASPIREKDIIWTVLLNWSGNFNEVRSGAMDTYTYSNYLTGDALVDGEAISSFYSYRFIGLDPNNGTPLFDDYSDRRHLLEYKDLESVVRLAMEKSGQRDPIFSGSFSTSLKYKNWNLSGSFAYSLGSKVRLLAIYEPISNGVSAENNVRKEFLNRWQVPGDEKITNIPALLSPAHEDYTAYIQHYSAQSDSGDHIPQFASNVWNMYDNSDFRVVSGNYLKCSSLSLRYNFDADFLGKTPFSNATISLNALNLFTLSAKELKGQHPSQQGFAAINMSIRPSYSLQFSITF